MKSLGLKVSIWVKARLLKDGSKKELFVNFEASSFPILCRGLPFGANVCFSFFIIAIEIQWLQDFQKENKSTWKKQYYLSQGHYVTLIKAMLANVSVYHWSISMATLKVKKLEQIQKDCLMEKV